MKIQQMRNSFLLFLTAIIWGVAFVAQSVGLDYIGSFTFNFVRCIIGGLFLIPCIFLLGKLKDKNDTSTYDYPNDTNIQSAFLLLKKKTRKTEIIGGVLCGSCLFVASNLQQFGIMTTSAGKAGFITACYIIIVPILGMFLKRRTGPFVWLGVIIALLGMYLLCIKEGFSVTSGDFLIFLCAIVFSFHILLIDYFSPLVNGVKMSCIQFFVCGLLSGLFMLIFEAPNLSHIIDAWVPILYAGIMSCGVAYTLQIIGQRDLNPSVASLIMSLESVVAVLAGWIILSERLTGKEIIGCVLMFVAIILAQVPGNRKDSN